ncbi:GNAT family N-acetyltransferase [Photobacterium alginatilyticum]|uniref:GNAT family N-acetyltransferase n=1 Tax=Photobacterium alginatilyticum TaxID=1775171 RepID=A0ABW9YDU4_9GAMM|nr:GNAT family N-acetyltransferase [Photobacterium alginatilyticum]NBI51952.1 GNAT family N-acetyltransferase [Photobacterium alginatilyticum]
MADKQYLIQVMTPEQLDFAIDWAAQEGWNPGLHDADSFRSADPNGFLVGLLDGEPIASISVVKYGDSFGFLGFYIVKPEYRGQGYGLQIWKAGLDYLDGRNIGLDGVEDQQGNYKKSGFKLAYGNIRYEGQGGGNAPTAEGLVDLTDLSFESIYAYDQSFFPAERTEFLKHWINQEGSYAIGVEREGQLAGYGVIRPCRSGYKVGPLLAENAELAEELFLALKAKTKSSDLVYLDVPEVNDSAVALAEKYAMTPVFKTARMYTKEFPDLPLDRTFGVTTFELG